MDTVAAAILLFCTFLFAGGIFVSTMIEKYVEWANTRDAVKLFASPDAHHTADYVEYGAAGDARSVRSRQEPEPEREREPMREPEPLPRPAAGTLYTEEQLDKRDRLARDRGAAEAIGVILGLGLLPSAHESQVMGLLFGPRGRRHQNARAIIADASAAVSAPPAPPITVRAGTSDEYEVPR